MNRTAVIREENGKYCVRSPNNPDWNGGCYDTKGEAEKRLSEVEYFKHKGAARVLARFWLHRVAGDEQVWFVKDWDNRTEYLRDCVWPVSAGDVETLVTGTSLMRRGNPKMFKTEAAAMREFERRMKSVDAMMLAGGYYRHMHGDGRIIYVNTTDRR